MPWYPGPALLEYLETVPVAREYASLAFRLPVQRVIRPNQNFRGFAGQIAAGTVRRGDRIVALPSGHTSRIQSIVTYDGELESATAPLSITVTLEDERDISRGDLIAAADSHPQVANHFEASMVWLHSRPLEINRRYLLKHTSHTVPARVRSIRHRINIETLDPQAADSLGLNAIGLIEVETDRPILADLYSESRVTGSFILIDPASNATIGAGMIRHILTTKVTNTAKGSLRIVVGNAEIVAELEHKLLHLGYPVVRTRVQDQDIWRALQETGVTVLVEADRKTVHLVNADSTLEEVADSSVEGIVKAIGFEDATQEERP
jgi:sulfate adenylyltransferase subunit 1